MRSEELDLGNIDGLLLLPITIEHTIDERSPLCGHTHESLEVPPCLPAAPCASAPRDTLLSLERCSCRMLYTGGAGVARVDGLLTNFRATAVNGC